MSNIPSTLPGTSTFQSHGGTLLRFDTGISPHTAAHVYQEDTGLHSCKRKRTDTQRIPQKSHSEMNFQKPIREFTKQYFKRNCCCSFFSFSEVHSGLLTMPLCIQESTDIPRSHGDRWLRSGTDISGGIRCHRFLFHTGPRSASLCTQGCRYRLR